MSMQDEQQQSGTYLSGGVEALEQDLLATFVFPLENGIDFINGFLRRSKMRSQHNREQRLSAQVCRASIVGAKGPRRHNLAAVSL